MDRSQQFLDGIRMPLTGHVHRSPNIAPQVRRLYVSLPPSSGELDSHWPVSGRNHSRSVVAWSGATLSDQERQFDGVTHTGRGLAP